MDYQRFITHFKDFSSFIAQYCCLKDLSLRIFWHIIIDTGVICCSEFAEHHPQSPTDKCSPPKIEETSERYLPYGALHFI